MTYFFSGLYLATSFFIWFFIGDLLFKISPQHAIIIICLILIRFITGTYLLGGKNESK